VFDGWNEVIINWNTYDTAICLPVLFACCGFLSIEAKLIINQNVHEEFTVLLIKINKTV
jgi:hypothetical protein